VLSKRLGTTVWLTGLPSSGKSTLAIALAARLSGAGHRAQILDADVVRPALWPDLGFSRADRVANVLRIEYVARLLAQHGVTVIVACIAPYADVRAQVRRRHEDAGVEYVEVYVSTPLSVCRQRDVKGLYARQEAGELRGLTGMDDVYEPPSAPDVEIDTSYADEAECCDAIAAYLDN
jgi:adenylylsulfate kinase